MTDRLTPEQYAEAVTRLEACLQPFGFTREDVELLRLVADANENERLALWHERADDPEGDRAIAALRSLAARIDALLPPEEK